MAQIGEAAAAGAAVDMSDLLGSFINDLVCRAVMGKSFRSQGRNKLLRELIEDTSPLLAGFNVEECFPLLARFGVLSKVVRVKSERLRRRWDELLDSLIEGHQRKYVAVGASDSSEDDDDLIHVVLSVRQEYGLTREQMKAILLDVFFAGIGTASSMLDFTMAELMRRPHLMEKLQAEVNSSVPEGADELVREADLTDMTYLRAVIKESLRLHPVEPLLPHFSIASCSIDGHTVPAGLQVLVNSWAIGRDARYWEHAEEFIPGRFIGDGGAAHVNFKGSDFQFLPFGSGRRMCAGVNFGIACVELILANLVHRFDWELPEGKKGGDIDMSEVFGLVVKRKEKLLLAPKLRV
jgi:cytochrome P450